MINIFRRLLPKISETEKAALLAGTISIDKNIMYGNLSLKYLKENLLLSLDKDDEVIEWLTPCRCER